MLHDREGVFESEIRPRVSLETMDRTIKTGEFQQGIDDISIFEGNAVGTINFAAIQYRIVDFGLQALNIFFVSGHFMFARNGELRFRITIESELSFAAMRFLMCCFGELGFL